MASYEFHDIGTEDSLHLLVPADQLLLYEGVNGRPFLMGTMRQKQWLWLKMAEM